MEKQRNQHQHCNLHDDLARECPNGDPHDASPSKAWDGVIPAAHLEAPHLLSATAYGLQLHGVDVDMAWVRKAPRATRNRPLLHRV